MHIGFPSHFAPGLPVAAMQSPVVSQPILAAGFPPPPNAKTPPTVHTEFGISPKHGMFSPLLGPLSHSSPNKLSEMPSPHIGGMQLQRQALGMSPRFPTVPGRQFEPVQLHKSPALPVP